MKHQQNNEKEVSAIAFMRSFDETMNLMESIGDNTAKEQKTLQENAVSMESYTDDEGVFDMDSMLDVDVADTEENQPRMYNTPIDELTESDKQLIVDEFADQLSKMHEEVIDFSDVGPIATVIQDKFGYKQNLEDFLTGLMTSSADKQDSQAFAHGKPVPGVEASGEEVEGGPADIEPDQSGPVSTGAEAMEHEAGLVADANQIAIDQSDDVEPVVDESNDVVDESNELDMGFDTMEEPEEGESEAEQTIEEMTNMDIPNEDESEDGVISDDAGEEKAEEAEAEEVEAEKAEEAEETDDDDDDLSAQLESIREKYIGKEEECVTEGYSEEAMTESDEDIDALIEGEFEMDAESELDAQLEAIKSSLIESDYPSTQNNDEFEKNAEKAEGSAKKGAEEKIDEGDLEENKFVDVTPQLESISNAYHAKEEAKIADAKAKLEAIEAEKKLDAHLESIASDYHNAEKAKVEAAEAEAKLDEKLTTLAESYHASTKIEERKEVKELISKLSK